MLHCYPLSETWCLKKNKQGIWRARLNWSAGRSLATPDLRQGCTICGRMRPSMKIMRPCICVIYNVSYGDRALMKTLCMRIMSRKTAKEMCGSRLCSVCGSRKCALNGDHNSYKLRPTIPKRLCTPDLRSGRSLQPVA